jgi:predicted RND superfamily exporter protein
MILQHKWNLNSKAVTHQSFIEKILSIYGRNIIRYRKTILGFGLGIVLIAAFGILLVKVEVDFTKFFKPGSEIRNSIDFMNKEMTGVMDIDIRFEGDLKSPDVLKKIQALQEFVDSHPNVYSTFSIVDVVKQMHRAVMDDDPEYETIPVSRDKVNNLFTLYSMSGDPDDFSSLVDYDYQTGLMMALMGGITTSMIVEYVRICPGYRRYDSVRGWE